MKVIDNIWSSWYLLDDGVELYLNVNAEPYGGTVRLTADEAAGCRRGGHAAADKLAAHLSYVVSELRQRHDDDAASRAHKAILTWQDANGIRGRRR